MNTLFRASCVLTLLLASGRPRDRFSMSDCRAVLDFTLQNSPTPQKYLIETMPGGVALLDYNNDGLLDIFSGQRRADHQPDADA